MLPEPVCTGSKIYTMYNPPFHYSLFRSSQPRKAVPASGHDCRRRGAARENVAVLNGKIYNLSIYYLCKII